jgi:hypothetical protein
MFSTSGLAAVFVRRVSLSFGTVAAFVAVNLLLIAAGLLALRQNISLRAETASVAALLTLANGTVVPPLDGKDWTGAQQVIDFDHDPRPTLVYTFSTRCPHCQQNWRAMRSLQVLAPRRLRIVYIDDNGDAFTPNYLAETGIGQSLLFVELSRRAAGSYNSRGVPQAVLVDQHGRVEWSHFGEMASSDISKARSLIERN